MLNAMIRPRTTFLGRSSSFISSSSRRLGHGHGLRHTATTTGAAATMTTMTGAATATSTTGSWNTAIPLAAFASSGSSVSNAYSSRNTNWQGLSLTAMAGGATLLALSASGSNNTNTHFNHRSYCDAAPPPETEVDDELIDEILRDEKEDDDDDDEAKEDPYDHLPEHDEPTHCSICLTYRQGPCRPYWRKVEACTKDNEFKKEDEEEKLSAKSSSFIANDDINDTNKQQDQEEQQPTATEEEEEEHDPPCLKYMMPWIDCATGYRNLYALIELDTNYALGIQELEDEAAMTACWIPGAEPAVDWTAWKAYVAGHPDWKLPKKKKTKRSASSSSSADDGGAATRPEKISLWKTLDTTKDPEVVEVLAMVPAIQRGSQDGVLECAYAVDQDGQVLGFAYGTKPSTAASRSSSDNSEDDDSEEEPMVELKIKLLPDRTRTVTLAVAYTHPAAAANDTEPHVPIMDKGGDDDDDDESKSTKKGPPLESHIFKSRAVSLKKISKSQ